jgi:hypothetical protein
VTLKERDAFISILNAIRMICIYASGIQGDSLTSVIDLVEQAERDLGLREELPK